MGPSNKNSRYFWLLNLLIFFVVVLVVGSSFRGQSAVAVELFSLPHYIAEGFDLNADFSKAAAIPAGVSANALSADLPSSRGHRFMVPGNFANFEYTIFTSFDFTSQYDVLAENPAIIPGILLPGLGDSFEIYLNGNLVVSEWYRDGGNISLHKLERNTAYQINPAFFERGQNILAFRVFGDPTTTDNGLTVTGDYVIDDFAIVRPQEGAQSVFVGIYFAIAVFFFLFFLLYKKEKRYLLFSLGTFFGAAAIAFSRISAFEGLIPDYEWLWRLILLSIFSLTYFMTLLVYYSGRKKVNTAMKALTVIYVLFVLLGFLPGRQYSLDLLVMYLVLWCPFALYTFAFILCLPFARGIIAAKTGGGGTLRRLEHALSSNIRGNMIVSAAIPVLCAVIDQVNYILGGFQSVLMIEYAFMFFFSGISYGFASEISRMHTELTVLSNDLQIMVDDKTRELKEQITVAEDARRDAERANSSKSQFLATMSHEIRTPMNSIIGVSDILLGIKSIPQEIEEGLFQISSSGHNLLGIINDILDLSKIETGRLELNPAEYDIPSLINDTVQLNLVRVGSKPIEFSLEISENLPAYLIGDELRIKQILNNLLSNAFKYTDKGTVRLTVEHETAEDDVKLLFKVSDTGQGMKPEDAARIFDEYTRFNTETNRSTEGAGLGMSITRNLVALMNGTIEFETEFGTGTTFTVCLPQRTVTDMTIGAELAEKLRSFSFSVDKEKMITQINREYMPYGKVLVVDDVETNLYVAKGLLMPYGLKIETALSGFETLERVAGGAEYDIIFMDHMMPQMDGMETTQKLRGAGYTGTIVALTANAISGNDRLFKENGFDDFISKPIDLRQLNAVLNKFVRDKRGGETLQSVSQKSAPAARGVDEELFEIFRHDARKAVATLTEAAESGDYKLFTTTVHAMKSAAAYVGEHGIAALAKSLEAAGNAGDSAYISAHTGELIAALEGVIGEDAPVPEEIDEDEGLLREQLGIILLACDDFDDKACENALGVLKACRWKPETASALADITEQVLFNDFDAISEKASALLDGFAFPKAL